MLLSPLLCIAQKEDSISLNGTWQILYDNDNEGRALHWMYSDVFEQHPDKKKIQVPSCWEEFNENYEGVVFYKRHFKVPAHWKDKVVHLQFDAVNYLAEVYINDIAIGYHEGGFTPFTFNAEHVLNFDAENVLTLRVVGPVTLSDKVIDGMGKMETPQWRGAYTGGIWQSVKLYATGTTYIDDVFIAPKIEESSIDVQVQINNTSNTIKNITLDLNLFAKQTLGQPISSSTKSLSTKPGINNYVFNIKIKNPEYWSPDHPYLYRLNTIVKSKNNVLDTKGTNFGMRSFTVKNNQFYLNKKPFFLKATFFEGLYPTKLAYPDTKEMAIKEIVLAKEAGFNMIRPWRKPPPEMWLDLADSLGVLTVGSIAVECMGKPEDSPYLSQRVENELRESILRDRNRACIVQWELFNELIRPVLKNMLRPMSNLARALDPSRMILDESGGWAQGANLYLPYQYKPTKFNDIHHYPGPNVNQHKFNSFLAIGNTKEENEALGLQERPPGRNVIPGLMSYISELGYGSLPNLEANNKLFRKYGNPITPVFKYHKRIHDETEEALTQTGINSMFLKTSDFYLKQQEVHGNANLRMIEAARSNPNVKGYCIHALTAGDWVIGAGLLDIWRQPKGEVYQKTKAANQPQLAILRVLPRNVYANEGTIIDIKGINELEAQNVKLEISIEDKNHIEVYAKTIQKVLTKNISSLFNAPLNTSLMEGSYSLHVIMKDEYNSTIDKKTRRFYVFKKEKLKPNVKIAVLENDNNLSTFLKAKGYSVENFNINTALSTLVIIGAKQLKSESYRNNIAQINEFVEKGGKAIYLEVPAKEIKRSGPQRSFEVQGNKYLPSDPKLKKSMGLWDGILHMVHAHPVFSDLPVHVPMVSIYENISPTESMEYLDGERIVNMIAFDRFPDADDYKRNYNGPGKVWWGSDVVIVKHKKGDMLLSTLKLLPNLGKDPVADKILMNMIKYMTKHN